MKRRNVILVVIVLALVGTLVAIYVATERGHDYVSVHRGPPVTEAECQTYGKAVEAAILTGDEKKLDRLFRADELAERVLDTVRLSSSAREMVQSIHRKQAGTFGSAYMNGVKEGGTFSFVRVRIGEDRTRILFRYVLPNESLDYVEVIPARHPDGAIVADDIYPMMTGEKMTQSLRRMLVKIGASADSKALAGLSKDERLFYDNGEKIAAIMRAFKGGRKREAYDIYSQLPAELKKDKSLQLIAITAVQESGGDEYLRELESFRANHPADPALDLLSYDYFLLRKNFKEAHACIDRLDERIGGDPYLSVPRGRLLVEEGRHGDAKVEFEKAIDQCPGHFEIYWLRITVATFEKNHNDTLEWLKKAVVQFDTPIDEPTLRRYDIFAPFLDSPQYQDLLKWHRERAK